MTRSVLIVDDNPDVINNLRGELENEDVAVESAGDAASANARKKATTAR